jgi:hypothetical protein
MKAAIKAKLLQMLRSGDYPKVDGVLHSPDGFCFGGILCELHRIETGRGEWETGRGEWLDNRNGKFYNYKTSYMNSNGFTLNSEVEEWAGIDENKFIPTSAVEEFLGIKLNPNIWHGYASVFDLNEDSELNLSFSQIADLVEKYIEPTDETQGE